MKRVRALVRELCMCYGVHTMKVLLHAIVAPLVVLVSKFYTVIIFQCFVAVFSFFFRPLKINALNSYLPYSRVPIVICYHIFRLIPTVWRIFGEITFQYIQWCYVRFGVPLNETHINKGRFRDKNCVCCM